MAITETARKSLMVSVETHARLSQIATKHDISQPELVDALLTCVDEIRLSAAIASKLREREVQKIEEEKKAALLKRVLSSMSIEQLENLVNK